MTAPQATKLPAAAGEVLGSYKLGAPIGRGGMGCVYRAAHVRLGREAAVKVLAAELAHDAAYVSRFFQEAKVVNEIRHPNIIDIIDFIEQESPRRVAYVMELLNGVPLGAAVAKQPFTLIQTINVAYQLADALSAVHSVEVVHRDLKPDNVFVIAPLDSDLGVVPSVKVLDFGIAKVSESRAAHRTGTGVIIGTPSYMAPEQITGDTISPATDVYALGEIMYEMLAGKKLFTGPTSSAILRTKLIGAPSPLSLPAAMPAPRETEALILACLSVEPNDRPTLDQVKESLLAVLSQVATVPNRTSHLTGARTFGPAPQTVPVPRGISATVLTPRPAESTAPSLLQSQVLPKDQITPARDRKLILSAACLIAAMMVAVLATLYFMPQEPTVIPLAPEQTPSVDVPAPAAPAAPVAPVVQETKPAVEPPPPAAPVAEKDEEKPVEKKITPAKKVKAPGEELKEPRKKSDILRRDEVTEW